MKQQTYKILLNKEPEGGYTVNVPSLPRCITHGENMDHAIEMAKEAIELYLESLVKFYVLCLICELSHEHKK